MLFWSDSENAYLVHPYLFLNYNIVLKDLIRYTISIQVISLSLLSEIGTAFGVLSDATKRRRYDAYGEDLGPAQTHRRRNSDFEHEFEGI